MLNTRDSRQVLSAGIGVAGAALVLLLIYVIGAVVLNSVWVVLGMAVILLFAAIAVRIMSGKAISS